MSSNTHTANMPSDVTSDDDSDTTSSNHWAHHRHFGIAIADPDAYVDGQTITQWTEQWFRWADPSAGGAIDAFNDPNGTVAAALNHGFGPMYFITQQASFDASAVRTFDVRFGESVLVPIAGITDSEGPGIAPTIPGFVPAQGTLADEVKTVLASASFTNGSYQLDGGGTVTNMPVNSSGIFNAGFAPAGSAGADFFGAPQGALLKTTGDKGFWVVLTDLSPGQHDFTASFSVNGHAGLPVHDIINVKGPF